MYGSVVLRQVTSSAMPKLVRLSSTSRTTCERLDDLQPQRADAERVHVRPQPARQPDVVLPTVVTQAHEAVEHVVVLVQPHVAAKHTLPAASAAQT